MFLPPVRGKYHINGRDICIYLVFLSSPVPWTSPPYKTGEGGAEGNTEVMSQTACTLSMAAGQKLNYQVCYLSTYQSGHVKAHVIDHTKSELPNLKPHTCSAFEN